MPLAAMSICIHGSQSRIGFRSESESQSEPESRFSFCSLSLSLCQFTVARAGGDIDGGGGPPPIVAHRYLSLPIITYRYLSLPWREQEATSTTEEGLDSELLLILVVIGAVFFVLACCGLYLGVRWRRAVAERQKMAVFSLQVYLSLQTAT